MTFAWNSPEDKGGLKLTSYNIYMAEGDGLFNTVLNAPATTNPSITVHTEFSLNAAQTYRFKVSASNFVGEGPISEEIFVIAADMPEKPTNPPIVTLITQTSISLTLEELPESSNGGSEVTGYIVQMDDGYGGSFQVVHDSLFLTLILSGLDASRFYRIRYAARNILYDSGNLFECDQLQWSEQISVLTAVAPSEPRNLHNSTSLRYRDALVYNWERPLYDGGSELQTYTLDIRHVETDTSTFYTITVQASTFKFESLLPANDYKVRIKVKNLVGESDYTDYVQARTGIEPTRPGLLTFVATTRTTIDLSWLLLTGADTGGSDENPLEITHYHLYIDDGLNGPFSLHDTVDGTTSTYTV
jgi:hypothetical protein